MIAPDTRVRRSDYVDALHRDDITLVLFERTLVQLGPLGGVLFDLAETRPTLRELSEAVEAEIGAPPGRDVLQATTDAVRELADQGVLTLDPPDEP